MSIHTPRKKARIYFDPDEELKKQKPTSPLQKQREQLPIAKGNVPNPTHSPMSTSQHVILQARTLSFAKSAITMSLFSSVRRDPERLPVRVHVRLFRPAIQSHQIPEAQRSRNTYSRLDLQGTV